MNYLDMIKCSVDALGVKSTSEPAKVTDILHQMVQGNLPSVTLLLMLPVHIDALKGPWEYSNSVSPSSR